MLVAITLVLIEASSAAPSDQVIEWIMRGGAPAFLAVAWWRADTERRETAQKDADRQERLIPVLTEFTGVVREVKNILEERPLPKTFGTEITSKMDEVLEALKGGNNDVSRRSDR